MKMSVSKFAKFTGVSVRTLHYYDEIGLLKPDLVDEQNGYRSYGENAFERMQEILFYRELDFSLRDIKKIISSPDYNKQEALKGQRSLLLLKRKRLDKIIDLIESVEKGERIMDFKAFDNKDISAYKKEVKERWGKTDAYKEHQEKTADYSADKWNDIANSLNEILAEFSIAMKNGEKADSDTAQLLVKKLRDFITDTQYTCTNEILSSLGEMYVFDERFKKNIDKNGIGTAEFINDAIKIYCENK